MTFEQQVAEGLRAIFREMRLVRAGRQDDSLRWSADDLATDLAPRVAAAIEKAAVVASSKQADAHGGSPVAHVLGREAALAALRGAP